MRAWLVIAIFIERRLSKNKLYNLRAEFTTTAKSNSVILIKVISEFESKDLSKPGKSKIIDISVKEVKATTNKKKQPRREKRVKRARDLKKLKKTNHRCKLGSG